MQAVAGDDSDLAAVMHRHLLRTTGADAVDALLRFHVRRPLRHSHARAHDKLCQSACVTVPRSVVQF